MRRFFTIILILLILIGVIASLGWLIARKSAVKNGITAPTFRQFINFGTKKPSVGTAVTGEHGLSSEFTGTMPTDKKTRAKGIESPNGISSSQFTSGPLTPAQNPRSSSGLDGSSFSGGAGIGEFAGGDKPPAEDGSAPTPPPISPTSSSDGSQCSDADTTIEFTPEEIQRLNKLQNRFYAIAGTLHNDADVQNERANYDEFKAKSDQITELYNYCQATAPRIQAPFLKTRITTPYWRDASRDGAGYFVTAPANSPQGIGAGAGSAITINPNDVLAGQSIMERVFRVNLW